jgi:hypothetical protein
MSNMFKPSFISKPTKNPRPVQPPLDTRRQPARHGGAPESFPQAIFDAPPFPVRRAILDRPIPSDKAEK